MTARLSAENGKNAEHPHPRLAIEVSVGVLNMPPDSGVEVRTELSPIEQVMAALEAIDPKWRIEWGVPAASAGWIRGTDFAKAKDGPFHDLLQRIGERLRSSDRRTIAASFALRFGWCSSVAIAPYLIHQCVPDIGLRNISLKFRDDTLFERTAIHCPLGVVESNDERATHPLMQAVDDSGALLRVLRSQLRTQAQPVVEAMYEWSGFSRKGAWGQITSSWASQFVNIYDRIGGQAQALPVVEAFFQGDDEVAQMQPKLHPVTLERTTHLYQRRASCCRFYLLPQGSLCASCPLVSQEERLARNIEWMKKQLSRASI